MASFGRGFFRSADLPVRLHENSLLSDAKDHLKSFVHHEYKVMYI